MNSLRFQQLLYYGICFIQLFVKYTSCFIILYIIPAYLRSMVNIGYLQTRDKSSELFPIKYDGLYSSIVNVSVNPFIMKIMPTTPKARPTYQRGFFFNSAAIEESIIAT